MVVVVRKLEEILGDMMAPMHPLSMIGREYDITVVVIGNEIFRNQQEH